MARDRETERIVSLFSERPGRAPTPEPDPDPDDSLWFWDPTIQIYPPDSLFVKFAVLLQTHHRVTRLQLVV